MELPEAKEGLLFSHTIYRYQFYFPVSLTPIIVADLTMCESGLAYVL